MQRTSALRINLIEMYLVLYFQSNTNWRQYSSRQICVRDEIMYSNRINCEVYYNEVIVYGKLFNKDFVFFIDLITVDPLDVIDKIEEYREKLYKKEVCIVL